MSSGDESTSITTKSEGGNARVSVKLSLKPRYGKDSLKSKYKVEKYSLSEGYQMGAGLQSLVPKGTPEYVEHGENYVERIMRALYHFKQCALIGPSGTGKSICEGEPVFVVVEGVPILTTIGDLFGTLSRRLPIYTDSDGWEVLMLSKTDVRVLSLDCTTGDSLWKHVHAIARSRYVGDIVEVTTRRNRVVRATPKHSFLTDSDTVAGGRVMPGDLIPIVRRIPAIGERPLTSVVVGDYVSGAKELQGGLVVGDPAQANQVLSPATIALDEDFSWFLGFFLAEGSIQDGWASVTNANRTLIARCKATLEGVGLRPWVRQENGLIEMRVSSKAFVAFLSSTSLEGRVGVGKGSQAKYKRVPRFMFAADETAKISFLKGFFEGGGWVEQGSDMAMGTSSRELANGIMVLLGQVGVFPTLRVEGDGPKSYTLIIGRNDAVRFTSGIRASPGGPPGRGDVEKLGVTPEIIEGTKMIGTGAPGEVASELDSPELLRVAESNVLWDEVKQVKKVAYDGWVYDFQVPGTETFSSGFGGIFTHNTHITYLVAELAGLPLWEINCGLQTSVYDLFGRFVGLGKENWVDGQIVSWCRYGGILYLDEANMMKQDIATRLNPILDTRGHMVLNERDNEVIPRHPNGYVIISMNPYSAEFAGTKPLNAAFRRRMSVWIDFDYLSVGTKIAEDEVEMISSRAKVDRPTAEKIVRIAAEIRRQYKAGDLPYAPSVGDLVNWATLVADGLTPAAAAEETIIALTSDDVEVQNTVRRIVRMIAGDKKDAR